jgi:hypothetical protein
MNDGHYFSSATNLSGGADEGNLDPRGTGFESRWSPLLTERASPYKEC